MKKYKLEKVEKLNKIYEKAGKDEYMVNVNKFIRVYNSTTKRFNVGFGESIDYTEDEILELMVEIEKEIINLIHSEN